MPKETIGSDDVRVVVKWRRDKEHEDFDTPGHVQIATLNPGVEDADQTGAAGWFADLDVYQISYLISVLRRAQRQAYPRPA